MLASENRYSIYDVMQRRGVFDANPANAQARDRVAGTSLYMGPVEYPKMMYHPQGKEKIVKAAEIIETPLGPKEVCQQKEIISAVVLNDAQERQLRDAGWHYHPAHAIKAANDPLRPVPETGAADHINRLEVELKKLQAQIKAYEALGAMPGIETIADAQAELDTLTGLPKVVKAPKH